MRVPLLLLAGCGSPEAVAVADYTLRLIPLAPSNQDPFATLDRVDLVLHPEVGEAVRVEVTGFGTGTTAVLGELPALEGTTIFVEGFIGEDVVAWGRSEPLTAATGEIESTLLVALTGVPAWLAPLQSPLASPLLAALGEGRFLVAGGRYEGVDDTDLSQTNDTMGILTLAPADETLAFADAGTLPTYLDAFDGDELRARAGATLSAITAGPDMGKFLVAGGGAGAGYTHGNDITGDVAIFDPESVTWTVLPSSSQLGTPRSEHIAATNVQGAVIVAGGWTVALPPEFAVTSTIEMWDASSGGFSSTQADSALASLDLVAGNIGLEGTLLCGGTAFDDSDPPRWSSSEHCALVALDGSVSDGPDLPAALTGSAMLDLPDGRILLTGGVTQETRLDLGEFPGPAARSDAWVYTLSGEWAALADMKLPRAGHKMALLPDGRVVVAGGASTYHPTSVPEAAYSCVELFDPATSQFTLVNGCDAGDAALGLGGRAWKPSVVVDPAFGALFVGGASSALEEESAASQVTLFVSEPP